MRLLYRSVAGVLITAGAFVMIAGIAQNRTESAANRARVQAICNSVEMTGALATTSMLIGQANEGFAPSSLEPGIEFFVTTLGPATAVEWVRVTRATLKTADTFKGLSELQRNVAVERFASLECLGS